MYKYGLKCYSPGKPEGSIYNPFSSPQLYPSPTPIPLPSLIVYFFTFHDMIECTKCNCNRINSDREK